MRRSKCPLEEIEVLTGAALGNVILEIKNELDRFLDQILIVVNLDIDLQLHEIADNLLAALGQ